MYTNLISTKWKALKKRNIYKYTRYLYMVYIYIYLDIIITEEITIKYNNNFIFSLEQESE